MGGSTSDHFGLPLEIGPAALVELTDAARAASVPLGDRSAEFNDAMRSEYGGSIDQAEELAADLTVELEAADRQIAILRQLVERAYGSISRLLDELEAERAARELAEQLLKRTRLELERVTAELERERRGLRETFSREGGR